MLPCTKPKDHGYAAEIWSHRLLAEHTRNFAPQDGHACLTNAAKATIQRILKKHPLQPHKVRYFTKQRDPEFKQKMNDVLIVYKEVNLQNEISPDGKSLPIITVSVDEKPEDVDNLFRSLNYKVTFPVLYDKGGTFSTTIGTVKFPETYWVSSSGEIIKKWVGPQDWMSGDILRLFKRTP